MINGTLDPIHSEYMRSQPRQIPSLITYTATQIDDVYP
jgi:hypothetical protein